MLSRPLAKTGICLALSGAIAVPTTANEREPRRVAILVESVDLASGEVAYRCPPDGSEVLAAVIGKGVTKNVSRLRPGRRASVRIRTGDSRPTIVEIEGSRLRRVLVICGAVVGVAGLLVLAGAIATEPAGAAHAR